eukprot:2263896-Pleurochrysis_carterae.AAC.2
MAAKSHHRCQAASSFLSVPGAAQLSAVSARAALSRCRCAGATPAVMAELESSRAVLDVATVRAASRSGIRSRPGRHDGERRSAGGAMLGADGSGDAESDGRWRWWGGLSASMRAAKDAPIRWGPSASALQLRSALRNCSVAVSTRSCA